MSLFKVYPLYEMTPSHAKGCYVFDKKGNKFLDFYGGHAVISIGHIGNMIIESIEIDAFAVSQSINNFISLLVNQITELFNN